MIVVGSLCHRLLLHFLFCKIAVLLVNATSSAHYCGTMHTYQHNNGATSVDEVSDRTSSSKFRLLSALGIIAFFGACSIYPILSGKVKDLITPICVQEPTTCPARPEIVCMSNNTEAINLLQEQLDTSNANIAYLVQLAGTLETTVNTYDVPLCSLSGVVDEKLNDIRARQDKISENILLLSQQIATAQQSQEMAINSVLKKQSSLQESRKTTTGTLFSEVNILQNTLAAQQQQYLQLGALTVLSQAIAQEVHLFDTKLSLAEDITSRIDSLQKTVSNFSCPAPVLPVLVVPPPVECPLLELPEAIALSSVDELESRADVKIKPANVPKEAPKDCLLIPDAQRLVTQLVTSEVELLSRNLTQYTSEIVEESAQTISVAAGDASLHALRNFLDESVEQHEKLQAETEYHLAQQQQGPGAGPTPSIIATASASKTSMTVSTNPDIPELDFAQLSAGSQVLSEFTSATYFPAQWRLDQRLQRGLDYLGLPLNVLSSVTNSPGASNEGTVKKLYDLLNLQKTVGVPEEALEPSTQPGACWPMQVQKSLCWTS